MGFPSSRSAVALDIDEFQPAKFSGKFLCFPPSFWVSSEVATTTSDASAQGIHVRISESALRQNLQAQSLIGAFLRECKCRPTQERSHKGSRGISQLG